MQACPTRRPTVMDPPILRQLPRLPTAPTIKHLSTYRRDDQIEKCIGFRR
jgi:hypothetical protein